jgi:isopropylmalate/homocitrate/citramalate synthase
MHMLELLANLGLDYIEAGTPLPPEREAVF